MACAIEAQRAGFRSVLVDKGCLCNSLFHYPSHMTFFTTSELLEIGDIPFPSINAKPSRNEALEYYRKVAMFYNLDIRQYQRVEQVSGSDLNFTIRTRDEFGRDRTYTTRKLVVATGYYDLPNLMNIPGEDLPKVHHYYNDPHPYYDLDVVVIGGKNSAAIAALELWRHGARVTVVYRGSAMQPHIKYWILPDIENRIKNGQITAYFNTEVTRIDPDSVTLQTRGARPRPPHPRPHESQPKRLRHPRPQKRRRLRHDRLPSRFRISPVPRRPHGRRRPLSRLRSGQPRKQRPWHLPRRRHRCRRPHQ